MAQNSKKIKQSDAENLEDLLQKIQVLEHELEEKDQLHKRALADYQNLQRRTHEDQQRFVKIAAASFISNILTPLDHLMRAQEHLQDKGIEMIIKQFQQALEQEGVKEIEAEGMTFDPSIMEAVAMVKGQENIVINVQQKGYTVNGLLLRPAKVEVGSNTTSNS